VSAAEQIEAILREKAACLTQADVEEIEALLTQVPMPEAIDFEGGVWETVWLIINDPLYQGDATLPDYSGTVIERLTNGKGTGQGVTT
jgi:hypothetical protein